MTCSRTKPSAGSSQYRPCAPWARRRWRRSCPCTCRCISSCRRRVTGAYMSILFLCAGVAPALVGWVSDRIGHRYLIVLFSLLSVAMVVAIPHLGSGIVLVAGLGLLGALLWALRPVIVSAAMSEAPQQLSGSIVALIYGANMGLSFLAPLMAGIVADQLRPAHRGHRHRDFPPDGVFDLFYLAGTAAQLTANFRFFAIFKNSRADQCCTAVAYRRRLRAGLWVVLVSCASAVLSPVWPSSLGWILSLIHF